MDKYLAISGGIGGAKLALGLHHCLNDSTLGIVANTGDDFEHFGLYICPDIDTLLYTLADLNNTELGWGRRDESWKFAETCQALGMDTWFRLGDRDLAIHLYRTMRLSEGASLSDVIAELCARLGIQSKVIPMSDMPVRTMVDCERGRLAFQEYFVKHQCRPGVSNIYFNGANDASPAPGFLSLLDDPALKSVIICPSNPFLSIQPVLSLPGLKEKLAGLGKPVIVVSPLIGGKSIKGPTEKIMGELGLSCSVLTIADLYRDIATAIVIDTVDEDMTDAIGAMGLEVLTTSIMMTSLQDKIDLAQELIALSARLHG